MPSLLCWLLYHWFMVLLFCIFLIHKNNHNNRTEIILCLRRKKCFFPRHFCSISVLYIRLANYLLRVWKKKKCGSKLKATICFTLRLRQFICFIILKENWRALFVCLAQQKRNRGCFKNKFPFPFESTLPAVSTWNLLEKRVHLCFKELWTFHKICMKQFQ